MVLIESGTFRIFWIVSDRNPMPWPVTPMMPMIEAVMLSGSAMLGDRAIVNGLISLYI